MNRPTFKSLAQLLTLDGHDEDDIFLVRPIRIAEHGESRPDAGTGRVAPSIMQSGGGPDTHKFNTVMAPLNGQARVRDDEADDGADEETGTDSGDEPEGAGSGATSTPAGGADAANPETDARDADTQDADTDTNPAGDPPSDPDTVVTGTSANENLSGGEGADTFVFGPGGGRDTIGNFNVDNDVLDLRAYGFASVDDVLSHVVSDGGQLALDLGSDRIVLQDVYLAQAADLQILFV